MFNIRIRGRRIFFTPNRRLAISVSNRIPESEVFLYKSEEPITYVTTTTTEPPIALYYLAGDFTSYQSVSANYLVKVEDTGTRISEFVSSAINICRKTVFDNQSSIYGIVCGNTTPKQELFLLETFDPTGTEYTGTIGQSFWIDQLFDGSVLIGTERGLVRRTYTDSGIWSLIYNSRILGFEVDHINETIFSVGGFTSGPFGSQNRISSANFDGTQNLQFVVGTGFNGEPIKIRKFGDNYLVVGAFTTYKGVSANRIIMIDKFGDRVTSFDMGTGFNGTTREVLVDGNDIYVFGDFTTYKGVAANRIIKLDANGNRDVSFVCSFNNLTFCGAKDVVNNRILVGHRSTEVNSTSIPRGICALNLDGSLDVSFNPGSGMSGGFSGGDVYHINIQYI